MSDIDNIYKNMIRFIIGYLCAMAFFGILMPSFLLEPLALRPIESKHDLMFYSFIIGLMVFSIWQIGYYVSGLALYIYRRFKPIEDES